LVDIMRQAKIPQIAPAESSDTELVRRALARDEAAVRAIMQANNRRLYRLARGILRNDSEAEDVVQEAYVRAFTHLESFRGDSSLSTWLSRITMNEALGRLRRQRPAVEIDSLPQGALEAQIIQFPLAASDDPEKSMAQREIQRVVEHAIDELPEAFRLVFITRVIEGMNVEETAEILSLKPETVKSRLHRARTMLRDNVERKIGPVVMEAFPFAGKRCERLTDAVLKRLGSAAIFWEPLNSTTIQPLCINNARHLSRATGVSTMFVRLSAAIAALSLLTGPALAQGAKPTDPQIAHIAYTAGVIDIAAAKQAIGKAGNKDVKSFAQDMVRDHEAVNKQALDLVKKLKVTPEDNDTSKTLSKQAAEKLAELAKLKGAEYDKAYVANEVAYHKAVNSALETQLIPSANNAELKSLLQTGLKIFQGHQQHAEHVAAGLK
jgi:RNA polymerase sigma-70 factor (ECF subfamily)